MQSQKQPVQPAIRPSEPDSRDWRSRPELPPTPVEDRFRQDQLNSHHGRGHFSSQQGVNHFSEISSIYIWVYHDSVIMNICLHLRHAHFLYK